MSLSSVPFYVYKDQNVAFVSKILTYISLLFRYPYIYNRDGTELHCLKVSNPP